MISPQPIVVGIKPWLPMPLSRSEWWTAPVAAERLAAVRIGVGLTLVFDALGTYLPRIADLVGDGSVTPTTAFAHPASIAHRLLLLPIGDSAAWQVILIVWAIAGLLIAAGILTRWSAAAAWFLSGSLVAMNPMLHNAGDQVRTILLLLLIVAPSSATWSWAARRRHAQWSEPQTKVLIYPWPLRLLYVQMAVIYCMSGLFKALGAEWRSGDALVILLGDAGWIRWPFVDINLPTFALRLATWFVIAWEFGFPVLMQYRRLQAPTLWIGVAFHIGTAVVMRVVMFPAYMLCLYLMFVPWETILAKKQS